MAEKLQRRLPLGAEVLNDRVAFRVWAPRSKRVEVVLEQAEAIQLAPEDPGYFTGESQGARPGMRYWIRLDGERLLADPASRFQPLGPVGPSEIIDSAAYHWLDGDWQGVGYQRQVLYEMHVGTFTPEGTFHAAAEHLGSLAELGITTVAMMPVADFRGGYGWGYDGVNLFAPTRLYGRPDDLRGFVDRAHQQGLGVILDVVYNHFGAGAEFLKEFTPDYFTDRYKNEWGEALNFDGPDSPGVRQYIIANAGYWIEEFHFDGLRLDATQQVFDGSRPHILAEITGRVRQAAAGRSTLIVGENEPQNTDMLAPAAEGGCAFDALWNDDFHHVARVAITGRGEGYYSDYRGTPQELVSAAKWGYLYQGQWYRWQKKPRGTPALAIEPPRLINYLQNHDQVANSARGHRLHRLTSPARLRAITALWLLMPQTPMFFQGQEFAADTPFLYFADRPEDAEPIGKGRAEFLSQFQNLASPEMQRRLSVPTARATFEACRLDHRQRASHAEIWALHRDLLTLRRRDAAFAQTQPRAIDGGVLGPQALVLRYFCPAGDRLLFLNLGCEVDLDPAPEPLLAPPRGAAWELLWSSESPHYGGDGTAPMPTEGNWRIPGECCLVFKPTAKEDRR